MAKYQLSEKDKADIRATFDLFDSDKDGKVSIQELATIIRAFFMVASEFQLNEFLAKLDTDHSGYVDYDEFENFIVEQELNFVNADELDAEIKDAFLVFDKDGNGYIDAKEFQEVMTTMGDKMTLEEAEEMMKEADTNGDGKIDYKEFCKHIRKNILA